jgi:hypothetical protein
MKRDLHLEFAKKYWVERLQPGDCVIDATCGNGHDTLFLAKQPSTKTIFSLDLQECALIQTQKLLEKHLPLDAQKKVSLFQKCHSTLPKTPSRPRLIVYNLGYLPKGNKNLTTKTTTTLQSLSYALSILASDGAISIMCYPGHEEGLAEQNEIIAFLNSQHLRYERHHYKERGIFAPYEGVSTNCFPNFFWISPRIVD